mmetsp:Transcript_25640/g.29338  ORF Transcript_25640/g.29338 Transcript_25640/m.29338 type:complete len:117 (-) Transcript_25640:298-648(-)
MLDNETVFKSKVFLRTYADMQDCVRTTAHKRYTEAHYFKFANQLIDAKTQGELRYVDGKLQPGSNFKEGYNYKLYQHSKEVLSKYFNGVDSAGSAEGLYDILYKGYQQMLKDGEKK